MTKKIENVTGIVLAGGSSRRMGFDKALLPWQGRTLLQSVVDRLAGVFQRVLVVGPPRAQLATSGITHVPDLLAGDGAIVGIHAGLAAAKDPRIFVMACDACYPSEALIRFLVGHDPTAAWVCPRTAQGLEPLFAVYSRACLQPFEELVARGKRRITLLAGLVETVYVEESLLRRHDPELRSLVNLNTPEDLASQQARPERPPAT